LGDEGFAMMKWLSHKIRRAQMKTHKSFGKISSESLRVSLGDLDAGVAEALARAFANVDSVEVVEGNLVELEYDAIVSPANSFGDMGGGIDKAIDDHHRGAAQKAVMAAIAEHFFGELPVGTAAVVELAGPRPPFLVASPTMRIPGDVSRSINAYLSMRAALVAILKHNKAGKPPIRRVAVPGLCTGVGGMPPREAAEQMRAAFDSIAGGGWKNVLHAAMAPYAFRR
jgi:O-acetyl-ADP-ribose deacetylase (regulator of RNase III)